MRSERRYVFDTNVIVSAMLFEQSTPGQALLRALETGVLLVSPEVVFEIHDVLSRPKFDRTSRS